MSTAGPALNLKQIAVDSLNYKLSLIQGKGHLGIIFGLIKFMLQRRVIKLYRDLFRTTNSVTDENTRKELRDWIRADFKKHKSETDEYAIKMLILHGERALRELQTNIGLSQ